MNNPEEEYTQVMVPDPHRNKRVMRRVALTLAFLAIAAVFLLVVIVAINGHD
jgi:cell division septal protein FtsQ